MARIGIRELRQHASRYVERVRAGETIEVTLRGLVVARLVPPAGDGWDQLVRAGRVRAAATELRDVEPLDVAAGDGTPGGRGTGADDLDLAAGLAALRGGRAP